MGGYGDMEHAVNRLSFPVRTLSLLRMGKSNDARGEERVIEREVYPKRSLPHTWQQFDQASALIPSQNRTNIPIRSCGAPRKVKGGAGYFVEAMSRKGTASQVHNVNVIIPLLDRW